jgi:hypothetical protein
MCVCERERLRREGRERGREGVRGERERERLRREEREIKVLLVNAKLSSKSE